MRLLLLLLLMPSLASAAGVGRTGAIGEMGGPVAESTCACDTASGNVLFSENFRDSSDYCNAEYSTNETEGANATIDPNNTDVADSDGGSCEVLYLASTSYSNDATTYATFTEQTGEVYIKWVFRIDGGWDTQWAYVTMGSVGPGSTPASNDVTLEMQDRGSGILVRILTQGGAKNVATIADANTDWHTLIVRYQSDGSDITYKWCPSGVCGSVEDSGFNDSNLNVDTSVFGWSTNLDNPSIYMGEHMVCNSSGGADCGW